MILQILKINHNYLWILKNAININIRLKNLKINLFMTLTIKNYLFELTFLNSLVLCVIVLIIYLVWTDDRFSQKRKILFLCISSLFIILSFYINRAPYEILQELFWYSLILNGSFIFHTLILDRLFYYFWKNNKKPNYEYYAFLVSRISFTFSLSFIIYNLNKLNMSLYNNYFRMDKKVDKFLYILDVLIVIIKAICLNFSIIFHNYCTLIIGLQSKEWNIKIIMHLLIQFSILLILSLMMGLPRLYIMWIILGVYELYNILNRYYLWDYKKFYILNLKNKLIYTMEKFNETHYLNIYYEFKANNLEKLYEKPYHPFFMFDLCRFLYNTNKYEDYYIQIDPFKNIYEFINWENLAYKYCKNQKSSNVELEELVEFSCLINKDINFINKFINIGLEEYDVIIKKLQEK